VTEVAGEAVVSRLGDDILQTTDRS